MSNQSITVANCARCGGAHETLLYKFTREPVGYTHWAMCPTTDEPILVEVTLVEETEDNLPWKR